MNGNKNFNEKESLNILKKNVSKFMKKFDEVIKIDPNDEDSIEKIEKILQNFPVSSDLATQIEAIRSALDIHIQESRRIRAENFNSVFNEYLNNLQKSQRPYRLVDKNTLRVEMLQLQTDPKRASIQFLFNKRELMPWKHVVCSNDIVRYENECIGMLKKSEVPEKNIGDIFYRAYLNALRKKRSEKNTHPDFIQIVDFYEEVQIELFRQQLHTKKSGDNGITISFPIWAFLYNVDRYRKMRNVPDKSRLIFETGSQTETKKNGVVLNGLDPKSDYKMFCYMRGSGDR